MNFGRIIMHYMEYCHSRHLRHRTMTLYEQTLVLFALWMEKLHRIRQVEAVREARICQYIIDLQSRGKYTFCSTDGERNRPQNRRDYQRRISSITINNYLRNLHVFFAWLEELEYIPKSPMKRIKALPEERKPREYQNDFVTLSDENPAPSDNCTEALRHTVLAYLAEQAPSTACPDPHSLYRTLYERTVAQTCASDPALTLLEAEDLLIYSGCTNALHENLDHLPDLWEEAHVSKILPPSPVQPQNAISAHEESAALPEKSCPEVNTAQHAEPDIAPCPLSSISLRHLTSSSPRWQIPFMPRQTSLRQPCWARLHPPLQAGCL